MCVCVCALAVSVRRGDGRTLGRPSVRESARRTVIPTMSRLTVDISPTRERVNTCSSDQDTSNHRSPSLLRTSPVDLQDSLALSNRNNFNKLLFSFLFFIFIFFTLSYFIIFFCNFFFSFCFVFFFILICVGVLDRSTEVTVGSTKIKLVYGADPRIGDKVISGETVHPFDGGVLANTGVMITVSLDVGLELTWDTGLSLSVTGTHLEQMSVSFFLSGTHLGHRSVSVCHWNSSGTQVCAFFSVWDSPGT